MNTTRPANTSGNASDDTIKPAAATANPAQGNVSIEKVQQLLSGKDDTSRFVGLALLKSILDNSAELRQNEDTVRQLWASVPPRFIDRLLRSGAKSERPTEEGQHMIDIAVAVLYTFTTLLPNDVIQEVSLVARIPPLLAVLPKSQVKTTVEILQILTHLVNSTAGASKLLASGDLDSLIQLAPKQTLALDVLRLATFNTADEGETGEPANTLDELIGRLLVAFKGTDGVTLLAFVDETIRGVSALDRSKLPAWLADIVSLVRGLTISRPTAAGRAAYTNLAASLLQEYPAATNRLLFHSLAPKSEKPFSYLFVNLLCADIRATLPTLLQTLHTPGYPDTAKRLSSAYDTLAIFISLLLQLLDDGDGASPLSLLLSNPDLLLKLRETLSETVSTTIEYLRDRWDASVAGVQGLHPEAVTGEAHTFSGDHLTLAWDSKTDAAAQDPLTLAALRLVAIWVREEDREDLRKEAGSLMDMLIDLYNSSTAEAGKPGSLDFRSPVLVMLQGIVSSDDGVDRLLEQDGWATLSKDLVLCLQASISTSGMEENAERGIDITQVLTQVLEQHGSVREAWLGIVTAVSGIDTDRGAEARRLSSREIFDELIVGGVALAAALLDGMPPGVKRQYVHSATAIRGIARQLRSRVKERPDLLEALRSAETALNTVR